MIKDITFDNNELRKAVASHRIINLNISLREAAKLANVSPATLSRIENGKHIDFDSFAKICLWMQSEPTQFFKVTRERQDGFKIATLAP